MSSLQIIYNLPIDEYHSRAAISKSQLAEFLVSPARYYGLYLDPDRIQKKETLGQRAGTLLHTLVLEPATFADRYAVGPDVSRNTKKWKAFENSLAKDITALKTDEYDLAQRQAASLKAHREIAELLQQGEAETSLFWRDEETGVMCRCRPDWIHPTGNNEAIILDIKTGPAEPRLFALQAAKMAYDLQDAMYSSGVETIMGKQVLAFVFGVVEAAPPYLSSCIMLDDLSRASAMHKYRQGLREYASCLKHNQWPGYEGVQPVKLPYWALELDIEESTS